MTEAGSSTTGQTLAGKTALVTGSSRGIGAGIALDLARAGAEVMLHYTSPSSKAKAEAVAAEIAGLPQAPPAASIYCADLGTVDGPDKLLAAIKEARGPDFKLDILVNNAGTARASPLGSYKVEDFDFIFAVNVRGPVFLTQALLPHVVSHGRIINISSMAARSGFANITIYASSKAALESLTRGWADELGSKGITVNTVAPGPIASDMLDLAPAELIQWHKNMTPLEHRIGRAEEVANVVTWLSGDGASWVTGQTISVSGGHIMH